jgi:hypothetical protein
VAGLLPPCLRSPESHQPLYIRAHSRR